MMKNIPGYPMYSATENGEIFSHVRNKFLKQSVSKFGYARVTLYNGNEKHKIMVHRLVALAFLDNPSNLPQVNHKNEDRLDNRAENLEWCTCAYNINYGSRNEVVSRKLMAHKEATVAKKVLQIDPTTKKVVREWPSMRSIEREMKIPHGNIAACCSGKRNTRGGYEWKLLVEEV